MESGARRPPDSVEERVTHLRANACLLFAILATACAHVRPYDRAQLAHPTMTTDDLSRSAEDHVRAIQEGAMGGGFSAGGGCGCN
jgi:hypothetical protein